MSTPSFSMYPPSVQTPAGWGNLFDRMPAPLWGVFVVAAALGLLTANPLLTAAGILALPLFMALLWRPGEPPILLFALSYQWLQVMGRVFHADVLGVPLTAMADTPTIEKAAWLGLGGLVVLALGMWLLVRRLGSTSPGEAAGEVRRFSVHRVFVLYLLVTALTPVVMKFAWVVPGLRQLLVVDSLKWACFFLLGYVVLRRKEKYPYLLVAVAIEFLGGIGFFSGFKTVIFFSLIVFFTVHHRLRTKAVLYGLVMLAALFILGAGWTSIKGEYRSFLNQGERSQSVKVSREEQLDKLVELTSALEWADIAEATEPLFDRIAYVTFFALAMDYVPSVVPHEKGAVWGNSIRHVLVPRLFHPDKPELASDSELTMQYTGLTLGSDAEGTSISIGYLGESYVDFGVPGLFFPVFVLGLLWGGLYLWFIRRAELTVVGYAFATAVLINASQFEMASIKLLGGVLAKFIVMALVLRFAMPRLSAWLMASRREPAPAFVHPHPA